MHLVSNSSFENPFATEPLMQTSDEGIIRICCRSISNRIEYIFSKQHYVHNVVCSSAIINHKRNMKNKNNTEHINVACQNLHSV